MIFRASLLVGHNVAAMIATCGWNLSAGMKLKKIATFCTMNYDTGITNLKRKVEIAAPSRRGWSELCAHYGITEEAIQAGAAQWSAAETQHDARYDTAAPTCAWSLRTNRATCAEPPGACFDFVNFCCTLT